MYRTNRKTGGIFKRFHRVDPSIEAREYLAERAFSAVDHGAQYLKESGANGFTVLHDDATGRVYDIDRPKDLVWLHNALPREQLFIIAKDNNKRFLDALATAHTTPWSIVEEYGSSPGYRVTTTGGYRDATGVMFIDHGMLIAIPLGEALEIGRKWNQQSVLELDNRGDALKVEFHNVE